MLKKLFILFIFSVTKILAQTGWLPVSSFGTNPGALNMYSYVPIGISGAAPLVVAMHGCTQNAVTIATEAGWNTLADRHKFYVVYPEQIAANNSSNCFNWFQTGDQDRNQGEAYSIKQMVDYMKTHYNIDTTKIFVTGLSAGACMTTVMLACYPEIFAKGAVMAGAPFKSATNFSQAVSVGQGSVTKTPAAWGTLVTSEYPGYTGAYPTVAVFQGSADNVINIANETEIMKQWTNVHQCDQTADIVLSSYNGNAFVTKNIFNDTNGVPAVETYTLSGMGHAVALDTGQCYQQCGKTGTYAYEVYFSSAFFAAYFFDILIPPYTMSGLQAVIANQNGVTYSVPVTGGSTYNWIVPAGAVITSGQGTNQINVNFGTTSGYIEVTETQSNNCKNGPVKLFVTVGSTGISTYAKEEIKLIQTGSNIFFIKGESNVQVKLYNCLGEIIFNEEVPANSSFQVTKGGGIYLAELKAKNATLVKKLVVLN
ncbi:MAG TPA: PHB depolymerase family esterase [Bacteroidia bacterium]|jgi:poly(hydroxyalkanoate) depolymerase family esterase|nr:PHB depolymerase family esterase [Bacteroidia bacterium]